MSATEGITVRLGESDLEFADFVREKLRPTIDDVTRRKNSALKRSLAAGAATFALFGAVIYLFFAPYAKLLAEHGITYWPIMVLLPTTMAVLAFCICYILSLRWVVKAFRADLIARMAEYIGPGIVHAADRALPDADFERSLLFESGGRPVSGSDLFRGRLDGAEVEFTDLRLPSDNGGKGGPVVTGLFFRATFGRRFRTFMLSLPDVEVVSLSALTAKLRDSGELKSDLVRLEGRGNRRQVVVESDWQNLVGGAAGSDVWDGAIWKLAGQGGRTLVSWRGDVLCVAMLSLKEKLDAPGGMFDGFAFGHCREFCRDARLCLDLARATASDARLFAE